MERLRGTCISIHASAREATIFRCPTPGHNHFNPRLREGGDAEKLLQGQSAFDFNPRLREGGDCLVAPVQVIFVLFQSTPPRGRRQAGNHDHL